jgi:hypothetical protein
MPRPAKLLPSQALRTARAARQDEFYTQLSDIEKEMRHYTKHFKGKTVLCNCDDPRVSSFFHFFSHNFERLRLKRLISTCYQNNSADLFSDHAFKHGKCLIYDGDKDGDRKPGADETAITNLKEDGDFRSPECVALLEQADIVVTNPPFSLFRQYIGLLVKHKKKFLVIGNQNAITTKEIFHLIMDGKVWFGASIHSGDREFGVPDHYPLNAAGTRVDAEGRKFIRVKGVRWFTNLDYKERHEDLILVRNYSPQEYPTYVNFGAIEVSKTADIPADYAGPMGVPITFLDKYNPDQFEILGSSMTLSKPMSLFAKKGTYLQGGPRFYLAGPKGTYRRMYDRLVIRNKRL